MSGLAISVLVMTSSPRTVLSASAAANLPRLGPSGGLATFAQLDLYANIETVGVVVGGSGLPQTAQLQVRKSSDTTWHTGHALMRIDDGRLVGSLFGLAPATSYNIKVLDGAAEISGSITTQPDDLPFTPSAIVHVSADAPPGGNGSVAAPFQTIQEGVNHADPGKQVLVADGAYHEAVSFPASGTAGHWIQLKAEGSGAILGGSENRSGNIWTPVTGQAHVYFTTIGAAIAYLARDQQRFYNYDSVAGLNQGVGHNQVPMSEGWYFEASTLKLFVRSLDDPAGHSWQIPTLNHAFDAVGRDWLWIEGFEMRLYGTTTLGCGVCTTNASHVVIRKNTIHNLQLGIFINWNGSDSQGNDTRIEYNEISDPPVDEWPWKAIDGSTMEGTAIVVRGHIGAIVRSNQLHNFFNGIYTGSSAALENSALAFDADIYDNYIHHIGDDALEPEGACINNRFRNNLVDTVFVGISLAPVTQGPTWVLRSSFTNYFGQGFKWDRASDGIVLVYHNTSWGDTGNKNAMDMISAVHNAVLRNNIFETRGYGVYEVPTGSTGHDWNNDNWYVRRTIPHFKWENVFFNSLADLCARTGLECQGYENPPGFTNPSAGDFSLLSSSPNIDRGVIIHGINDDFAGNAPDVGAFEYAAGPSISGNAGVGGATLSFVDGTPRTVTADGSGNYSFTVPYGWSGTVTPTKTGFTFTPPNKTYTNVQANQTAQNYTAIGSPHSISGNAGVAGVTLSYMDGALKTVTTDASGNYSLIVSYNWSGTVTPTQTGYTFISTSKTYTNVQANQIAQNYTAAGITYVISGNAGVEGATLSYTDGIARTATVDSMGNYSFRVSYNWTGTVTPTNACYTFNPLSRSYGNVLADQTAQDYANTFNSDSGCANVAVSIAGVPPRSYGIPSGASMRPSYPGVNNGPMSVTSTNGVPIIATERLAWLVNGTYMSIAEIMGLPDNQLTDTYVFSWYNDATMDTQLRIGNVGGSSTDVTVTIGTTSYGPYPLLPGEGVRPSYPGVNAGPVTVQSTGSVPIVATQRLAWMVNGAYSSITEMMGLPSNQLRDSYDFAWYNDSTMDTQLRIGNVGASDTDVTVTIGTTAYGPYTIRPSESIRPSYPGVNAGPVTIQSTDSVPIIATERLAWMAGGVYTSIAEMMGLPDDQLRDTYVFSWYNDATMDTQLRIGNVGGSSTDVTVTIGTTSYGPYPLLPGEGIRPSYVGVNNGSVTVHSTGGVPIIATERLAWMVNGAYNSITAMLGLPGNQLTTSYVFAWYNNGTMDTQLRLGVP